MECKFNSTNCSHECKNYSICAYSNIQDQINNILININNLTQLSLLLLNKNEENQNMLINYTTDMLDLINSVIRR